VSRFVPLLSGREARRASQFGRDARRRGAGWTRAFKAGREQRVPYTDDEKLLRGLITLEAHRERTEKAEAAEAEGEN
jgi:hypothetical protein